MAKKYLLERGDSELHFESIAPDDDAAVGTEVDVFGNRIILLAETALEPAEIAILSKCSSACGGPGFSVSAGPRNNCLP